MDDSSQVKGELELGNCCLDCLFCIIFTRLINFCSSVSIHSLFIPIWKHFNKRHLEQNLRVTRSITHLLSNKHLSLCSLNALRLKKALQDSQVTALKLHAIALSPHTAQYFWGRYLLSESTLWPLLLLLALVLHSVEFALVLVRLLLLLLLLSFLLVLLLELLQLLLLLLLVVMVWLSLG